jgi:hypothetical protein
MQAGRLDADAAYGVGTVTNGSRWSSAVDRQTGATSADMGDAALLSYGRGLEQAHPSTGSPGGAPRPPCSLGRCRRWQVRRRPAELRARIGAGPTAPPCHRRGSGGAGLGGAALRLLTGVGPRAPYHRRDADRLNGAARRCRPPTGAGGAAIRHAARAGGWGRAGARRVAAIQPRRRARGRAVPVG